MTVRYRLARIAVCACLLGWGPVSCGSATQVEPGRIGDVTGDAAGKDASVTGDTGAPGKTDGAVSDGRASVQCGTAVCTDNEICVFPPCGCRVLTAPKNDAGQCPQGFKSDDAGLCYQPPNCPRQPPYCAVPGNDGQVFMCSGKDGTLRGIVGHPVSSGQSRVCYDSCP